MAQGAEISVNTADLSADDHAESMSSATLITGTFRSAKPISSMPAIVRHPQPQDIAHNDD